jgi:ABC-type sugar transport system substrate-binding protein
MKRRIVASFLSKDQEFQVLQAEDARAAAARRGLDIEVLYADMNAIEQIQQLFKFIYAPREERPAAIIVETVVGEGLERVARNAAQAGIGWVLLNRKVSYLEDLRERYPGLAIAGVSSDQLEVGRIQGRQFRVLLPSGGAVLYLQGPPDTSAAQERFRGMEETIEGAGIELKVLSGQWTEASGEKAVQGWLRLRSSETFHPQLVGNQNDAMAVGARRALLGHGPEWASIPFTGCDGLPEGGQRLVREGVLAATIITPSNAGPAVDLVAAVLESGERPPAQVTLSPRSFPPETEVARSPRPPRKEKS